MPSHYIGAFANNSQGQCNTTYSVDYSILTVTGCGKVSMIDGQVHYLFCPIHLARCRLNHRMQISDFYDPPPPLHPPFEEWWKGHIVLPLSARHSVCPSPSTSSVSNLQIRFSSVASVSFEHISSSCYYILPHKNGEVLWVYVGWQILSMFDRVICPRHIHIFISGQ